MGTPTKRTTKTKKNLRRSHHALASMHMGRCAGCDAAVMPHRACQACGSYKGKQVLNVTKRTSRRIAHLKPIK